MKKYFFIAVAAVIALAACTKNNADTTAYEQSKVINFNTVVNKATKTVSTVGPISGTTFSSTNDDFGVFAYYLSSGTWASHTDVTPAAYMSDVAVGFNDDLDIWAPSSTYYWPLQGTLTFIAYWPKESATASFSNTGLLTLSGFTQNTTVASQVDLLYSAIAADKDENDAKYTDTGHSKDSGDLKGVNIKFKHALSQIIFKAKAANEVYAANMSFKINSIVVNAASTATSMTVTNPAEGDASADITTWTAPASFTDFTVNATGAFPDATEAVGTSHFLTNSLLPADAGVGIGAPLLMIPSKAAVDPDAEPVVYTFANDPTVSITYTLYRTTDALPMGSKTVTVHFNDIDSTVKCWEAGKKYEYDLTIDLEKIYFNPTVTDWAEGGTQAATIQ